MLHPLLRGLVWAALCSPALPAFQGLEAVEREWLVRRWALAPADHAEDLARSAAAPDWELRQAACEALWRAAEGGLAAAQLELARAALSDEHPNVRAAALAAADRAGLALEADELARLARDPWPEVRLALVRFLARRPAAPERAELLALLAADPDPALARAARDATWAGAFDGLDPPADLGPAVRAPEDFLACLSLLARGRPDERWLGALLEAASELDPLQREARVGLVTALELASSGRFDERELARGWLAPVGAEEALEATARALRLTAAAAVGQRAGVELPGLAAPRADLALELARRAAVADALARGAPPFGGLGLETQAALAILAELQHAQQAGIAPAQAAELLLEGALLAAGPAPTRVARTLRGVSEELASAFWSGAGLRARTWEGQELAYWLTGPGLQLRARTLEAMAQTFARSGDEAAAWALGFALEEAEPELRAIAFAALARAPDPLPFAEALASSWRREDPATRLARLRWLPRAKGLHPFRAELIELWESGASREVGVLELLRAFAPDAELAAWTAAWLEEELDAVEAERAAADGALAANGADFAPPNQRPRETAGEGRAQNLVQAYAELAGAAGTAALEAWLERAAPVSIEVSKILASALARSAEGRARLAGWLGPQRRSRLRVEAALGLLGEGPAHLAQEPDGELARRALAVLLERLPHCDQPLRARILSCFAGYAERPEVRARLVETALGGRDLAERLQALSALARERARGEGAHSESRAATEEALAAVLARSAELDVRRAAIVLLGRSGGPLARGALDELAGSARGEELEHVADLLLPARARLDDPPSIEAQVLLAARAAAREELLARFAGTRLATREFVYRGELSAARHLAEAGRLAAVLEGQAWWELDARFLLLLGERLLDVPAPGVRARALEILRAGSIGLEGEAPAVDRAQLQVAARSMLARAALAGERPAAAAAYLEELLFAWRLGELGPRQLFGPLGPPSPGEGRDPVAWLEASWLQARAHAALERGDAAGARTLAAAAAERLGASERARAQQQRLEASLE